MKLLVIDIQKGITDSRHFNFDEFIKNTSRIIQAARDNQIEVIYFQHDDGPGRLSDNIEQPARSFYANSKVE